MCTFAEVDCTLITPFSKFSITISTILVYSDCETLIANLSQLQSNNYATFYDEAKVNWSIMFNSSQDADRFTMEVTTSANYCCAS